MLKPNRKYFPQQPTSGSWNCWCLPGMVSGHLPPWEPEPGTRPALCGPPRPGAAPGLARWLRLHGQSHITHRLPRPLLAPPPALGPPHPECGALIRPRPPTALRPRPQCQSTPRPAWHGLLGAPPTPRPSQVESSRSPAHTHNSASCRAYPPKLRPCLVLVLPQPRLRPAQNCP